jgi:hypothetical protein
MNQLIEVIKQPDTLSSLNPMQWEELIRHARHGKMLGTLAAWCKQYKLMAELPREVRDLLSGEAIRSQHLQLQAQYEMSELEKAFTDTDFPIILLKGAAYLRTGMASHQGRRLSDVDLLIEHTHLAEAEVIMHKHGWKADSSLSAYDERYYRNWSHELPPLTHPMRGMEIDLHHNLIAPTSRIKLDIGQLIKAAKPLAGSRFSVLCDEDLFIHSAVHLLFNEELRGGIRDIVDLKLMAEHFQNQTPEREFWPKLYQRSQQLGVQRPVFYAVDTLSRFFDMDIPNLADFKQAAPIKPLLQVMQRSISQALAPPIERDFKEGHAHQFLYLRSHWLRMPPWLLLYHLTYKALLRFKHSEGESAH